MRRIRSKDTSPELQVRRLLHQLGYRYRTHIRSVPGNPDIVFGKRRKVVFVHGCFWHSHEHCSRAHAPQSNTEYWSQKLRRTKKRDAINFQHLRDAGWEVFILWECEVDEIKKLDRLYSFLGPTRWRDGRAR